MYDGSPPAGAVTEHIVYLREFFLPCDEIVDFRDLGQTEADRKCNTGAAEAR